VASGDVSGTDGPDRRGSPAAGAAPRVAAAGGCGVRVVVGVARVTDLVEYGVRSAMAHLLAGPGVVSRTHALRL
jgi:hypothetical protein